MRGGTLFSGIGAPEQAADWIDWRWCAEIEPFPSAVLAARHPHSINLGDVTKANWNAAEPVDIMVFGSPCQSFSVAGKRLGLDDPRGNLALVALSIVRRVQPRWFVFENVPGLLSSDEGRDFGAFLETVGECGYGFAYRVLDAQYFGVPQRRRRVFVVGCLGNWRAAAAVLFERESLRGDPAPRREAGERAAGTITRSLERCSADEGERGNLIAPDTARCDATREGSSQDWETTTMVAHALRADGFDASEDGTGRGTPLVACDIADSQTVAVPMGCDGATDGPVPPLMARSSRGGAQTLSAGHQTDGHMIGVGMAVRRLTPRECERLQGFPDDYTLVTHRGKPAADSPRYKALGNSMAVPVMRWILERVRLVDGGEP
jgi:DNA (cytosine-5)-methyltransferase 1